MTRPQFPALGLFSLKLLASWNSPLSSSSRSSLQKPKSESRLLDAGCRLSNNLVLDKLIPGYRRAPGFDSNLHVTTPLQRFRFIRLSDSHLPEFAQHFDSNAHTHGSLPQQLSVV